MARRKTTVRVVSNRAVVVNAVNQAMRRKVMAMGVEARRTIVNEVLVGERTGRWYRKPKGKGMYRASAPGEAPASRTGDLRRSYKVGKLEVEAGRVQVKVGTALEYAEYLEHGTNHMHSRPHLEPALRLAEPRLRQILAGDWGV